MSKNVLQILSGIGFFIWARWLASDELRPELFGIAIGIFAVLLIELVYFLFTEYKYFRLYLRCFVLSPNSEIRLSMAYLFKIECRGKYLLVKNSRFENETYQPVGGVYKYFHPEATDKLSKMSIITDNSIQNDEVSEHDLRLKMSESKYLRKFLKWFSRSQERETYPFREFYEELVATNILPKVHFNYVYCNLVGQHFEPIHKDPYYKLDTFKYVDVYTPRYINRMQEDEVVKLLSIKSERFIWVTEEEIKKKFSNDGKRISDHTNKIFSQIK